MPLLVPEQFEEFVCVFVCLYMCLCSNAGKTDKKAVKVKTGLTKCDAFLSS